MKHLSRQQKGFTLVEAIVAIGILSSALLGTLVLAAQSINVSDIAQTKTQAEFLAAEGIELARAFRENAEGNKVFVQYDSGCNNTCPETTFAEQVVGKIPNENNSVKINIDATGRVCDAPLCSQLYRSDLDNLFILRNSGSSLTRFSRTIQFTKKLDQPNNHPYIEVTSSVQYTVRGTAQPTQYSITTDFYDWM